jgi:hypothetical protein
MIKKKFIAASLIFGMLGSGSAIAAASAGKSAQIAPKRYSIEQFMATTSLSGVSFSADETRLLFSSNESGIFNAYTLPVNGGKAEALT